MKDSDSFPDSDSLAAPPQDARTQFSTTGDSDNPIRALNTHGQTGTCLEHGSQPSSGKGHAGISPQASGQRDQEAERPVVEIAVPTQDQELIEAVAAWDHNAWAGWMRHLFSKSHCRPTIDGMSVTIPAEWAERWMRQMNTQYAELSEEEKESDRKEARSVLAVIAKFEGRLALTAWQDELRDRMEKFLRGGDDSDQQGIDLGERVRGWLSLLPPPDAEGETRCDLDPLANVNEMGTGNIK